MKLNIPLQSLLGRSLLPRLAMTVAGLGLLLPVASASAEDPQVRYLSQTWFQKADNLNLLHTPGGHRLAVDNLGRYIADESLAPEDPNIKYQFDSIHERDGVYYIARFLGNHGYDYNKVGTRGNMLTGEQIMEDDLWRLPLFRAMGHHMHYDRNRGDLGMAVFPEAGLAFTCGQSQWDSRATRVSPFRQGDERPEHIKPEQLPIYTRANSSVRSEDMPDRAFVDYDGGGFWYLGTRNVEGTRKWMLAFVLPKKNEAGIGTLTWSKLIPVGDFDEVTFENGVVISDKLFLLIANKDDSIGGVQPERRLLRIDRATGDVAETKLSFDIYLDDVRVAAMGEDVAVYSQHELRMVDGASLEVKWTKTVDQLIDPGQLDYRFYGVSFSPNGDRMAVGLATPYRKPGEPTHVLTLKPDGRKLDLYQLKPGSIDQLVFIEGGGLLVYSAHYTAEIGTRTVLENEARSIAIAEAKLADPEPAATEPSQPFAYLEKPLNERFKVWFDKPTDGFGKASFPIGNGHMGVMLDGGTDKANIVVNVDSQWTGDSHAMGAYQGFSEISVMLGHDPKQISDYRRELDLRTGIHTVSYEYAGTRYKREAFASYPAGLFAIRFTADKAGAYTGDIELMSMHPATFSKSSDGIEFAGTLEGNHRKFKGVMKLATEGGRVVPDAGEDGKRTVKHRKNISVRPFNTVRVENADSITLYMAGDTDYSPDAAKDFRGEDPAVKIAPRLANIGKLTFDRMKEASARDVATLFDQCTLDLATSNPEAEALPIDQRKDAYSRGASDPGFEALVFAAQRHMMIASSRPGSLPANLQGIWNNSNWPAWTSDYHSDINIQMAYWFTEPANLAECSEPLFDYMESQIPVRRKHSKAHYGDDVRGWNVHYMNNIFGGYSYKDYPAGSAWYAQHFAEHFKFNQNKAFLKKRAYPVMKELSQHWEDLLIERPDGVLVSPRTMSPEHKPPQYGISQDTQLIHNLFTDFVAASKRLGRDDDFRETVADMRERLLPIKIGRWGQIQEWERDRDNRYCSHRHPHQMIAAFPGSQITTDTPELAQAVVTGLEARGTGGGVAHGGGVGWSQVWRINHFARVGRPDLAYRQVRIALPGFHDHLIWQSKNQIDAPCGYASGVCEMLLQSHRPLAEDDSRFLVELLPALPEAWPTGRILGLRARGGFEVDLAWEDGKLLQARIRNVASPTDECVVQYGDQEFKLTVAQGEEVRVK